MTAAINRFYNSIEDSATLSGEKVARIFGNSSTVETGGASFTAKLITQRFKDLNPFGVQGI